MEPSPARSQRDSFTGSEDTVDERRPQPREALEARTHGREALELARGEAEPLPAVDGGDAIDKFEFEVRLRLERPKLLRR